MGDSLVADVKALNRVLVMFIPVPIFWTLYDQQGSSWTLQAEEMQSFSMVAFCIRCIACCLFACRASLACLSRTRCRASIPSWSAEDVNFSLLQHLTQVLLLIPVFEKLIYPLLAFLKVPQKPLQRMGAGL